MTRNELYDAWYKAHRGRFEPVQFDGLGDYQSNAQRLVQTWEEAFELGRRVGVDEAVNGLVELIKGKAA